MHPDATLQLGLSTPAAHGLTIAGITFVNYSSVHTWAIGACSRCDVAAPFDGGFGSFFSGVTWVASPMRRNWRWSHEGYHVDTDGKALCEFLSVNRSLEWVACCFCMSGTLGGITGASYAAHSELLAPLLGCALGECL